MSGQPAVILVDTLGELGAVWGLADVAFVGGSLDGRRGGQNMIEPAAYGAAVLFGPHVWNFPEPMPLSARNDVLVFQTPPLAEDLEVTGEVHVKLWVSSSAPDTDFTAKLVDVHPAGAAHPGGFDMILSDGIARARFRDSLKAETFMEPGLASASMTTDR